MQRYLLREKDMSVALHFVIQRYNFFRQYDYVTLNFKEMFIVIE